jgi:hypothetical protein
MNFIEGDVEGGNVRVGRHSLPAGRLGRARGKVKISFRPEELVLVPRALDSAEADTVGRIPGSLTKSTFTGPLVSYAVDCGAGITLTVERHKPAAADILAVGAPVTVIVPREAVLAFDPQTGVRA